MCIRDSYDTHNINSTGIVTAIGLDVNGNGDISGNLSVGGVLTYEDVTNIDSVGIITARDGLKVLGGGANIVGVVTATGADINGDLDVDGHTNLDNVSVAGVSTFSNSVKFVGTTSGRDLNWNYGTNTLTLADHVLLGLGNSNDLLLHHTGTTGYIKGQTGNLYIQSDQVVVIGNQTDSSAGLKFNSGGAAELFHNNNLRLATTAQGINVSRVGGISQIGISQTTTTAYSINGTISFINSSNTTAQIQGRTGAASTTGDILFLCNTVGDESLAILEDGKVRVPDRGRFVVGTDNDLNLYHDSGGSGSHIQNDNGTNLTVRTTGTYLYMHGNNIHLRSQTGNETMSVSYTHLTLPTKRIV